MLNPLSYTNKTYATIYRELKNRFPNKPDWFMVAISGLFDVMHWYLDARAQNLLLPTAFTEEAIYDLCAYLDYYLSAPSPASGIVKVTIDGGVSYPKTILRNDLVFSVTNADGEAVIFEAAEDLIFTSPTVELPVMVLEGETLSGMLVGESDGISEWQEFVIEDADVLPDTVVVNINSLDWSQQETLVNSTGIDEHFRIVRKPDGYFAVLFGDNTYGMIPGPYPVFVTYRKGGGVRGNIKKNTATISYSGSDNDVVSVAMDSDFTGGSIGENIEKAKFLAPQMIRVNYRAVTESDYEVLSRKFSSSVIMAKALPGLYGAGSVGVHVVPAGGGLPSTTLKTNLEVYLRDRSVLNLADVRVRNPLYVSQGVNARIKMRPNYSFALYEKYAELTVYLLISERTKEILDLYKSEGINSVVDYVNNAWGFTFGTSDNSEITNMILRQMRDGHTDWGGSLRPNDIVGALDNLSGVDYAICDFPVAPVTVLHTQIMTEGTVGITQI